MTDPVLFSFRPKCFFEKKTAKVRLEDSNWSDKFSLGAGSSGLVTCKTEEENRVSYQLGVTVKKSQEGLTKQVIFTPYYIFSNLAPFGIDVCEVREFGARRDWISLESDQTVPFWPHFDQKWLIFRVTDTHEETLAIYLDNPRSTLLKLNNNFGGLFIDFQVSDSSVVIVCLPYEDGRAPLMLANHSQNSIRIREKIGGSTTMELAPLHACYYTWRYPNGERTLIWGNGQHEREFGTREITPNASGSFEGPAGTLEWISFQHGRQRVLLFTDNKTIVSQQRSVDTSEPAEQSVVVSLHGLGILLVDKSSRREIVYAGITGSNVLWETARMHMMLPRYRAFSTRLNILLEEVYQQYLADLSENGVATSRYESDDGGLVVDFKEFKVLQPKVRLLRRSYRPGLEFELKNFRDRRRINVRLNKLQIDNQLEDCVFPVVFAPVPPRRTMAIGSVPQPFLEVIIVERASTTNGTKYYENVYFRLGKCQLRADMSLVNGIKFFFVDENEVVSELEHKKFVEMDIQLATQGIVDPIPIRTMASFNLFFIRRIV